MINKTSSDIVKKIDTAVDYVSGTEIAQKATKAISTAKDKIEEFDLSDLINNTFNPITDSSPNEISEFINSIKGYDSLLSVQKNNAKIDSNSLANNKLKISNLSEIADSNNDKNYLIKKTTLGMNGEEIDYSSKKTSIDGSTIYYDKDGNKVKIVNPDGTVTFNGKTIQKDGTVIDSVGRNVLVDGSSYKSDDLGTSVKKSDGTEYFYDVNGKLTKINDKNGNSTIYNYDENGNVTTIEVSKKEANADGSYRTTIYNEDGSYSVTDISGSTTNNFSETTNYDKDGNVIGRDTITRDGANGEIVKTDGNTKSVYNMANDELKYTEETNGGITTKTYYNHDGTVDKVETIENGNVTQTISKYSNGDYKVIDASGEETEYYANGTAKDSEINGAKTYYYENGQTKNQINADGTEIYYNEDGSKIYEKFSDGTTQYYNNDGSVDYYDENMNLIKEVKPDGSEVYW